MSAQTILIVEDEPKLAAVLADYLTQAGFTTDCRHRGDGVVAHIRSSPPALVLLDLMLPGVDGIEICRQVRRFSTLPIIMVTARVEEVDRLVGLELGADDYICKPFSPREVVARVKAVLRRTTTRPEAVVHICGPIRLDDTRRQVTVADQALNLTPNEYGLLKVLISYPEKVFSRAELLDRVQGYQFDGYDRTIDTHVKNLRKKIAAHLPDQEVIRTVYGVGYRFSCTD